MYSVTYQEVGVNKGTRNTLRIARRDHAIDLFKCLDNVGIAVYISTEVQKNNIQT